MHAPLPSDFLSFDYATIRVVPRVERAEFVNAGVIVFCLTRRVLISKIHVDEAKLKALWPAIDIDLIREHLEVFPKICGGDPDAGPIAQLPIRERFHWLVAPRSTMIQVAPVHTGLCSSPELALAELYRSLVE